MNLSRPSRTARRRHHRLGAYGMTAVLGLFTAGGLVPQCSPPPPISAPLQVGSVQDKVVSVVNQHRANAGRRAVAVAGRLTTAAQNHANDMAQRQVMTHTGTGGTSAGQRITAARYTWSTWAENVAAGQKTAADVMNAWMNSPGHRANILNGSMVHIGVAAAKGSNGVVYWTMVLAAAR